MIRFFNNYLKGSIEMKAKINEWVRTALIMLGESVKLSEM